jgi:hypothetical protein
MDPQDTFLNPTDESNDESEDESKDESSESDEGADSKDEAGELQEQLRSLQSERDKETARANKAEKQLSQMGKAATAKSKGNAPAVPPEVAEWIIAAKDSQRKALYEENKKLAQYKVSPDLIVGDSPAEMRASAESLSTFVDELEGQMRGNILTEHGFDPEPKTGSAEGRRDFKTMDSKEFNALVDDHLKG